MNPPLMGINMRGLSNDVQEILKHLDHFFLSQSDISSGATYGKDALIAHIDIALFKTSKESKKPATKLSSLNELDLANEMYTYCTKQKIEYVRYCVFEALFTMTRSTAKEHRRQVLVLLTSLAIALKSSPVLECVGLWLATTEKEHALYLVSCLEKDFCQIMPESAAQLKSCNTVNKKFCNMVISAFGIKYTMKDPNMEDMDKPVEYPPHILLEIIHEWMMADPSIVYCVIHKMDQLWHTVLTSTRTPSKSLPLCSLSGMIQWSVKLPFAPDDMGSKTLKHYSDLVKFSYTTLQSRLHFSILNAIMQSHDCLVMLEQGVLGNESNMKLWGKSDAHLLVGGLLAYGLDNPEANTLAVDRFSQISQLALASKILGCTREQFQSLSDPLPKTKLLELVAYGSETKISNDDIPMSM